MFIAVCCLYFGWAYCSNVKCIWMLPFAEQRNWTSEGTWTVELEVISVLLVRTLRINVNNDFDAANIRFAATRVIKTKNMSVNGVWSERRASEWTKIGIKTTYLIIKCGWFIYGLLISILATTYLVNVMRVFVCVRPHRMMKSVTI